MSEKMLSCPQCGKPVEEKDKQCFSCGCYLAEVSAEEKVELTAQQVEAKEQALKETETEAPISDEKLQGFLVEDIKRFWNGFWGEKMPKRFQRVAQGKISLAFSGALLPSVWLAFRKKFGMSFLVMLINYGLPFALLRLAGQSGVSNPARAQMLTNSASIMWLTLGAVFAFYLPAYFYSETKKDLEKLGCKDRDALENKELNRKISEAGRPSFIFAILSVVILGVLSTLILGTGIIPIGR